ncbi:hypothetical protein BDR03DRAFT_952986 [Suillus americanus]|nr:hypothetical protein BDR03DRAFT_952986 [Suillus americanus]
MAQKIDGMTQKIDKLDCKLDQCPRKLSSSVSYMEDQLDRFSGELSTSITALEASQTTLKTTLPVNLDTHAKEAPSESELISIGNEPQAMEKHQNLTDIYGEFSASQKIIFDKIFDLERFSFPEIDSHYTSNFKCLSLGPALRKRESGALISKSQAIMMLDKTLDLPERIR